jgi:Undecaprenyl-phosphate glucose phosphotransferase
MPNGAHALAPISLAGNSGAAKNIQHKFALPFYLVKPVVIAVDFLLILTASLFAGLGYHWLFLNHVPPLGPYIVIGIITFLNFATTIAALGAYRFGTLGKFGSQAFQVTAIWVEVFLILLAVAFSLKIGEAFSRAATFGFLFIGWFLLIVWRGVLAHVLVDALTRGTFAKQKTIIIGERPILLASQTLPELQRYGYTPDAVIEIDENEYSAIGISETLRDKLNLAIKIAREQAVGNILLFIGWEQRRRIRVILEFLSVLPIPIHLVPDDEIADYLRHTHSIGDIFTSELKRAPLTNLGKVLKRAVDLVGAGTGVLLLAPVMIAVALLIKLDSNGPIIFTQSRSGFNGRLFRIFKFRSMTVLEDGPIVRQATREDHRFTRLGRWLRRTNIDELPQLFNVLRGDMSLVGPRPHAVAHDCEYESLIAAYTFRYQFKPGITGWAQLNGYRGETRTLGLMSKRVELDLWYIKNWSIWLDIKILIGTIAGEIWRARGY